ncbi:MAG: RNA 2',3'-cyclic phosphodiesterase [Phycisphaerae bacterium]|nr:RNA 2',3'-cyclic phosphodiesterase [Phycisphaerae bacterium]
MSHRTFIALDVNDAVRRRLGERRDAIRPAVGRSDKINWVSPENFHVTLKFLGDVPDAMLLDVCQAVQSVAGRIEPFDFTVRGIQAVPPAGRNLRMFWADVTDPDGKLVNLFAAMEEAMEGLGFPRETRPFAQHITLARVKYVRDAESLRVAASGRGSESVGVVRAEQVTVYTSQLTQGGSIYTPTVKARLGPLPHIP